MTLSLREKYQHLKGRSLCASSRDANFYCTCEQRRLCRDCANAQSRQSLHCSYTQGRGTLKGSGQYLELCLPQDPLHGGVNHGLLECNKYQRARDCPFNLNITRKKEKNKSEM